MRNFEGARMSVLNYANTGWNFLVYGADAHEFFYGGFNDEIYHKFCYNPFT